MQSCEKNHERQAVFMVAFHEASHAVVAHEFGIQIELITLGFEDGSNARAETNGLYDWIDGPTPSQSDARGLRIWRRKVRRTLTSVVAGYYGNWMLNQERVRISDLTTDATIERWSCQEVLSRDEMGKMNDYRLAINCAIQFEGPPINSIRRAEQRAHRILRVRWQRVTAIAKKLEKRIPIRGHALDAILRSR